MVKRPNVAKALRSVAAIMLVGGIALYLLDQVSNLLNSGAISREIVARIPSPDKHRIAVVLQVNGGATVAYAYSVCVQPGGEEAAMVYAPTSDVAVRWIDEKNIEVSFLHARFVRKGVLNGLNVLIRGGVDLKDSK